MTMAFTMATVQGAYQYGDEGGEIPNIQKQLNHYGYKAKLNGVYDKDTKWAVRLFQKDKGLTVDGIVGPITYEKLMGKKIPKEDKKVKRGSAKFLEDPQSVKAKVSYTGVKPKVKEVLEYAHTFEGVPYVFGGTTPNGFDCSGYIRYIFSKKGIDLPRMADEQYQVGKKVAKHELQPGDLVFFETYEPGISHSGMYIGNGKFISATTSRGVAVDSLTDGYWGPRFVGAKRVL